MRSIPALRVWCAMAAVMLALLPAQARPSPPSKTVSPVRAASAQSVPIQSVFEQEQQMSPAQLVKRWQPLVAKASKRFGLPVPWINAVMRMESGGRTMLTPNQRMISDKGAMGIMQLMPQTYQEMRDQYRLGADPFDPTDNIPAGTAYLRWLKGKYGYPAMFAAYNAGPGQVDDLLARGTPLPQETKLYVAGIGKILDDKDVGDAAEINSAKFTRPDGSPVLIDPIAVRSVRDVFPGEYASGVRSVIDMGVPKQGVTEDAATVTAAIRIRGGKI
jgi:membrane-bound lytic murein transglycosylase B